MDAWLQCEVGSGQLGSEFTVRTSTVNGDQVTLFAPEDTVRCQRMPVGWEFVPGAMKVERVDAANDDVLIKLPAESFELGYFVKVRRTQLDAKPQFQEA